jgi:hypothetical protein
VEWVWRPAVRLCLGGGVVVEGSLEVKADGIFDEVGGVAFFLDGADLEGLFEGRFHADGEVFAGGFGGGDGFHG